MTLMFSVPVGMMLRQDSPRRIDCTVDHCSPRNSVNPKESLKAACRKSESHKAWTSNGQEVGTDSILSIWDKDSAIGAGSCTGSSSFSVVPSSSSCVGHSLAKCPVSPHL